MNGTYLRFYVHENVRQKHSLLYEWLLQHAKGLGCTAAPSSERSRDLAGMECFTRRTFSSLQGR